MDKEESTEISSKTASSTGDNNNRCGPHGMGCNNTFNFIYTNPGQLTQAMRGMVFNNVSSFQQQAGVSGHPLSVGGVFPNYYQEPLEFHPNSNGQYNSMLQYQPQRSFHQPLQLSPPSLQTDGCVGNFNSFSSHTGILNTETDKLSRLVMSGDYSLKQYFYLHGLRILKVIPKLDLFANGENMKYTRFCALLPSQKIGTEFMGNAMHLIWPDNKVLLIHPPIPLILKALRKFEREGKEAVLIVPGWKGQIWTPLLKRLSVQKLVLGDAEVVLEKGPNMKKKELALPPGNIEMYLLKNYVQRTQSLCCAS
jgi:hypothetical protein